MSHRLATDVSEPVEPIEDVTAKHLELVSAHDALGAHWIETLGYRLPELYAGPEGATEPAEVVQAEDGAIHDTCGVADVSYRGAISVSGPEAEQLLNRIVSSEVDGLAVGRGQLSSLLTAKGKTLGVFRIDKVEENDFLLRFADPLTDAFRGALEKYAFLSDVQVIDESDERATFLVVGPRAAAAVEALFGCRPPAEPFEHAACDWDDGRATVSNDSDARRTRLAISAPAESGADLWQALLEAAVAQGGRPVGHAALEICRVEDGQARFGTDFGGENFPNEAGYEAALTYSKCYVGQEVVARMRTYGHVNRVLRGLVLREDRPGAADPGALLGVSLLSPPAADAADGAEERPVGELTSCVRSPRHGLIALSLVRRQHWTPGTTLRAATSAGSFVAVVSELPFQPPSGDTAAAAAD